MLLSAPPPGSGIRVATTGGAAGAVAACARCGGAPTVHLAKRTVWSLAEARASLERLVGMTEAEDWSCLDDYLLSYVVDPSQRATVFASSFAAALELVREGEMELNQKEAFAPLYFRKRPPQAAMPAPDMTVE